MPTDPTSGPPTSFDFDDSVIQFNIPVGTYLHAHQGLDAVATGALVFNSEDKMLLIQRAGHDSMPNRWEIPGGGCDLEDPSILHGLAREVWEESGLVVTTVKRSVDDGHIFFSRRGLRICKFTFEVEVESSEPVKLDPNEHQDYVWVTEEECLRHNVDRDGAVTELKFTTPEQEATIREGFRLRKKTKAS